jgi:hypothetical protein
MTNHWIDVVDIDIPRSRTTRHAAPTVIATQYGASGCGWNRPCCARRFVTTSFVSDLCPSIPVDLTIVDGQRRAIGIPVESTDVYRSALGELDRRRRVVGTPVDTTDAARVAACALDRR